MGFITLPRILVVFSWEDKGVLPLQMILIVFSWEDKVVHTFTENIDRV